MSEDFLHKKLKRAILAREEAERILEEKSKEIYEKNKELERLNKELETTLSLKIDALEESEKERFKLFGNTAVGIAITHYGKILKVNNTFAHLLGYEIDEVLKLKVKNISFKEDMLIFDKKTKELYEHKTNSFSMEKRFMRKNNTFFWAKTHVSVVTDKEGDVKYHLEIIEDIQEKKIAENRMDVLVTQLRETNTSLENFAHIVSHDLKAPLSNMNAVLNWMKETKLSEQQLSYHTMMDERVNKMYRLIEGIIEYSKVTKEDEERVAVKTKELINDVLQFVHIPNHIYIEKVGEFPTFFINKAKLSQVFSNLLSNAIRHIDKPKGIIKIQALEDESHYIFKVKDNGIGIDAKYYTKIFTIFNSITPSKESTGIGLTLVKKIVEQYKGKISVQSEVGEYTEFTFSILKKTVVNGE